MKKLAALILCAALALAALAGYAPVARAEGSKPTFYIASGDGYISTTPHVKQYEYWNGGNLKIVSTEMPKESADIKSQKVKINSVNMVVDSDVTKFPFEITQVNYLQTEGAGGTSFVYSIPRMRVRGDAPVNFYDITFEVNYTVETTKIVSVNSQDKSESSEEESKDKTGDDKANQTLTKEETTSVTDSAEVTFRVLVTGSSSTSSSDNSVPKVIITGNTTNPTSVVAGEPFVLGITLKNTSSSETITNLVASMDAGGTFKPVSGSSSLYIASLAPGESKSVSLRLTSKADTSPDSYTASFAITYDAANSKDGSASSNETIAIPVTQVPKVSATKLQLQPADIYVNQDLNVMSTINNTGKSKIYNLTVTISDSAGLFDESETYLGNIEAGSTGNVDVYVAPTATGSTTLRMTGEYEDENGTKYTVEQTSDIEVMEQQSYEPIIDDMTDDTEQSGGKWWLWLILVLAVAGLAAAIVLRARAKKKAAERDRQAVEELNRKFIDEDRNAENK
jgi:hypothetical protein